MIGFAKRLRHLRTHKNMTLDELAAALNSTKTTLSRYENNKRSPDAEFIVKTAQFFAVSADYLLDLSNHPMTVNELLDLERENDCK